MCCSLPTEPTKFPIKVTIESTSCCTITSYIVYHFDAQIAATLFLCMLVHTIISKVRFCPGILSKHLKFQQIVDIIGKYHFIGIFLTRSGFLISCTMTTFSCRQLQFDYSCCQQYEKNKFLSVHSDSIINDEMEQVLEEQNQSESFAIGKNNHSMVCKSKERQRKHKLINIVTAITWCRTQYSSFEYIKLVSLAQYSWEFMHNNVLKLLNDSNEETNEEEIKDKKRFSKLMCGVIDENITKYDKKGTCCIIKLTHLLLVFVTKNDKQTNEYLKCNLESILVAIDNAMHSSDYFNLFTINSRGFITDSISMNMAYITQLVTSYGVENIDYGWITSVFNSTINDIKNYHLTI